MSLYVTARFRARAGQADQLIPLLVELADHSRTEPGCLSYDYFRSGDRFTSFEHWATPQAETGHNQTAYLDAILTRILPLLDGRPEVTRWSRLSQDDDRGRTGAVRED
ncbi:putative quinol monooxygenase [Paracoccus sp. M683]|uniref:putative quinol monooxygenase n=1 Tax=Paracoccus sp. M683 TaxID=2594268 RepID=UPI00163D79A6|nr:putative quinol monooxygenase [Paracoccus sp. M683]